MAGSNRTLGMDLRYTVPMVRYLYAVMLLCIALAYPATAQAAPDRLESHRLAVLNADQQCRYVFDIFGCWPHRTSVEHTRTTRTSQIFLQDLFGEGWHATRFYIRRDPGVTRVGTWYCSYDDRPDHLPTPCFGGGRL
jgi:hypothetical protein